MAHCRIIVTMCTMYVGRHTIYMYISQTSGPANIIVKSVPVAHSTKFQEAHFVS